MRIFNSGLTMSFMSSVYVLAAKNAIVLVYIVIPRLEYKVVRHRALAQSSFRVNTMMTRIWATRCTHAVLIFSGVIDSLTCAHSLYVGAGVYSQYGL